MTTPYQHPPLNPRLEPPDPRETEPDDDNEYWDLDDGLDECPSLLEQLERQSRP